MLAHVLFADFNSFRAKTWHFHKLARGGHFAARYLNLTEERAQLFAKLGEWCSKNQIDPRLWLHFLFESRKWRFTPPLTERGLCSENLLKAFKRRPPALLRKSTVPTLLDSGTYDPNRDLTPSVEELKKSYAHNPAACMDELLAGTLGFHPGSMVCRSCALRVECAVRLESMVPFSMLQLRAGQLTSADAERAVKAKG